MRRSPLPVESVLAVDDLKLDRVERGWSGPSAGNGLEPARSASQGATTGRGAQYLRSSLGRDPSEAELALTLGITLRGLQLLLGEISGLELGSLRVESPLDGREQR